jgi:hypothetical protein
MIRFAALVFILTAVAPLAEAGDTVTTVDTADSLMVVLEHDFRGHPRAVRMDFVTQFVKRGSEIKRTMWGLISGDPVESWFLYVITEPKFMEGTSLLFQDWADAARTDSIWLYLPSFKQFRALERRSQRSVIPGTALTYEDSRGFIPIDKYDLTVADSASGDSGTGTITLVARPKSPAIADNVGYQSLTITVDRAKRLITHIEYRASFDRLIKTYEVVESVQQGDVWYPARIRVEQIHQRTISFVDYQYWPLAVTPDRDVFRPSVDTVSFLPRLRRVLDEAGLDIGF